MLTEHGFFHIIEASTGDEGYQVMKTDSGPLLTLIQLSNINDEIMTELTKKNSFLILSPMETVNMTNLVAKFGVKNFLAFPFSSKKLIEKIEHIL